MFLSLSPPFSVKSINFKKFGYKPQETELGSFSPFNQEVELSAWGRQLQNQ